MCADSVLCHVLTYGFRCIMRSCAGETLAVKAIQSSAAANPLGAARPTTWATVQKGCWRAENWAKHPRGSAGAACLLFPADPARWPAGLACLSLKPTLPPQNSSRFFLRQINMLFSHVTLILVWPWAWALLAILVASAVASRVRRWLRLRHIPGPPLAGWSKAIWLLRKSLGGRFHLDTAEVCEKYGQCLCTAKRESSLRIDTDA